MGGEVGLVVSLAVKALEDELPHAYEVSLAVANGDATDAKAKNPD